MKQKQLVCLDTSVALHILSPAALSGQEAHRAAAMALLGLPERFQLAIPAPVIFECLVGLDHSEQAAVVKHASEVFRVLPLDLFTAAEAARVWWEWRRRSDMTSFPAAAKQFARSRNDFKIDLQVIGTASRHDAVLCTTDEPMQRVAVLACPKLQVSTPDQLVARRQLPLQLLIGGERE